MEQGPKEPIKESEEEYDLKTLRKWIELDRRKPREADQEEIVLKKDNVNRLDDEIEARYRKDHPEEENEEKVKFNPEVEIEQNQVFTEEKKINRVLRHIEDRQGLSGSDLRFLYEITQPIEHPAIKQTAKDIREHERDPKIDILVIHDCSAEEVAWGESEVNEKTKVYVGPLFDDFFIKYPNIRFVYTSFPEGRIYKNKLLLHAQSLYSKYEIEDNNKLGICFTGFAENTIVDIYNTKEFRKRSEGRRMNAEEINIVKVKVRDLGIKSESDLEKIYEEAKKKGLKPCYPELGFLLCKSGYFPGKRDYNIGTEKIRGKIFHVSNNGDATEQYIGVESDKIYDCDEEFVFQTA